jgi:hypothetical protein
MGMQTGNITFDKIRFMKFVLLLLSFFSCTALLAQYDLRTTDITKLKNFDGNTISFFGLHKGMTKQEAVAKLNEEKQLTWYFDSYNTKSEDINSTEEMRIYVNMIDNSQGEKSLELMYLIWKPGATTMSSMVIFKDAAGFTTGGTKKLFVKSAVKPKAPLLAFLHSVPVKKGGITNTWHYAAEHFTVVTMNDAADADAWFEFAD